MRFSRTRIRLLLAIALLTPALLYWGLRDDGSPDAAVTQVETDDSIDFFMLDAHTRSWGESGALQRAWETPHLQHYPKRKSSQLDTPIALLPLAGGDAYKIRANQGWIIDDQSEIQLAGDVQVHHNPQSDTAAMLTTSEFTLYPERRFGRTDALATLISGKDRTESVGMEIYFDERRVELLSTVRGRYETP